MQEQLEAIDRLRAQARHENHRYPVVVAGPREDCRRLAEAVMARLSDLRTACVGDDDGTGAAVSNARIGSVLGSECDLVVYDAWSGFDPDAFGAVSGTIRGGGLLLLLTPPLDAWPVFADPQKARIALYPWRPDQVGGRFLARLARVIAADPAVLRLEPGLPPPDLPAPGPAAAPAVRTAEPWLTEDQRLAVAAVEHVGRGRRRRPAVLIADRGRGKSAALGIAAARLIADRPRRIVVTAPRPSAAAAVFHHAALLLPRAGQVRPGLITSGAARIEFAPPDALAFDPPPADLVLVDEAAAMPAPLLERMLARYSRIAFATTVHGYEGTGRGFALRFRHTLNTRTPGWREVMLHEPVRWAPADPLERFTFRSLLLDATPAAAPVIAEAGTGDVSVERLDRGRLAADEERLDRLFGLLVLAHYQTRPSDLRTLLDGPGLRVWCLRYRGQVAAAALVAREGGFDGALARAVWLGQRRPRGHLIPQSLASHAGFEAAARLHGARVLRIAVHPAAQGRGLGTRLLAALVEDAGREGMDFIGASFGASRDVVDFWQRSGLTPVRLGTRRDAASGTHSVIVLRPLSEAGSALRQAVRGRFISHLPYQLADPLRDLDPLLAVRLLQHGSGDPPAPALDDGDWRDLVTFAFGRRRYADCRVPLWRLAVLAGARRASLPEVDDALLAALAQRVLQGRSWGHVAERLGVAGRAAVEGRLRETVATLLQRLGDNQVLTAAGFPGGRAGL